MAGPRQSVDARIDQRTVDALERAATALEAIAVSLAGVTPERQGLTPEEFAKLLCSRCLLPLGSGEAAFASADEGWHHASC